MQESNQVFAFCNLQIWNSLISSTWKIEIVSGWSEAIWDNNLNEVFKYKVIIDNFRVNSSDLILLKIIWYGSVILNGFSVICRRNSIILAVKHFPWLTNLFYLSSPHFGMGRSKRYTKGYMFSKIFHQGKRHHDILEYMVSLISLFVPYFPSFHATDMTVCHLIFMLPYDLSEQLHKH